MEPIQTGGFFLISKELKLLVAHPTHHAEDFWSIPKGKIDEGESIIDGALRELWEESNVDLRETINLFYHELNTKVFNNKRKKLKAYVVFESENEIDFSKFQLQCNSNVEPEIGGFPEMDDFHLIDLDDKNHKLHHTQVECIKDIRELIKKLGY